MKEGKKKNLFGVEIPGFSRQSWSKLERIFLFIIWIKTSLFTVWLPTGEVQSKTLFMPKGVRCHVAQKHHYMWKKQTNKRNLQKTSILTRPRLCILYYILAQKKISHKETSGRRLCQTGRRVVFFLSGCIRDRYCLSFALKKHHRSSTLNLITNVAVHHKNKTLYR